VNLFVTVVHIEQFTQGDHLSGNVAEFDSCRGFY